MSRAISRAAQQFADGSPNLKSAWKLANFLAFLPGTASKVEVTENKGLNPLYPALKLHTTAFDS